jgi:phenylalanyl-tRNA synthetase beta chain
MVDLPGDPAELVAEFVRTGTEVEAVETLGANLDHVVVGELVEVFDHPDSDHMHVTMVNVGAANVDGEGNPVPLQVVCGAPNVRRGAKVVCAMIGACLPGDFKIKKSKLRGVESCGMNCSSRELGLDNDHAGIMILPDDAPVGTPIAQYLGLADTVLDLEITPNRPDCLSMEGLAREVSAMYNEDLHLEADPTFDEAPEKAAERVAVTIEDAALCQRYVARVLRGVKIGPSPEWLKQRLVAAGSRPINNVVDVTNYVMYLTGQPLHAFDLGKLSSRDGQAHIVVRAAREGEELTTLDGEKRLLTPDMCVITDAGTTPVALAGVMGGLNSEIDEGTVDVLLESACFDPGHTSRTSRNLDLMSEASIRYERGVDVTGCRRVADLAAALFVECAGATVLEGAVDAYPAPAEPVSITLRPSRANALMGATVPTAFMMERLERLGCRVTQAGEDELTVVAPVCRPDLTREVDLIEEVLRLWGMDKVTPTLPAAKNHAGGLTPAQKTVKTIGQALREAGLSETLTYNFADPRDLELLNHDGTGLGEPVVVLNPLVQDQSQMRRMMLPGMLRAVAYNLDHGVSHVALYEQGRVFIGSAEKSQPAEPEHVCGVLSGPTHEQAWYDAGRELDFFDAKAAIEHVCERLHISRVRVKPAKPETCPWLQPGRAAIVMAGKKRLGWVGNVHPSVLARFGIDQDVVAFDLSQDELVALASDERTYQDVPQVPGVKTDLSLVVDEAVTFEELEQRVQSAGGKLLARVELFDVYRDPLKVGPGKKSMAVSLLWQGENTLTAAEVDAAQAKLIAKVEKSLGAHVRAS